jgi:hypothetical protein
MSDNSMGEYWGRRGQVRAPGAVTPPPATERPESPPVASGRGQYVVQNASEPTRKTEPPPTPPTPLKATAPQKRENNSITFPPVVFFFTIDQIAAMLSVTEETIRARYLYYIGRTPGRNNGTLMDALNIEPDGKPEWRIAASEFKRWLKRRGFTARGASQF